MSKVLDEIYAKAKKLGKTIVLPEGEDKRVVEAACEVVKQGLAKIILLGNEEEIKNANPTLDLTGVTVLDPKTCENSEKYAELLTSP